VRFESDLAAGALTGLYWATIGWLFLIIIADVIIVAILAALVSSLVHAGDFAANTVLLSRQHPFLLFGVYIANYLVIALIAGVVVRVYLTRGVWERVVTSVTAYNLDHADAVQVRGDLVSALGEGLVDGLDVAGF
jgi:hypothetical protein